MQQARAVYYFVLRKKVGDRVKCESLSAESFQCSTRTYPTQPSQNNLWV